MRPLLSARLKEIGYEQLYGQFIEQYHTPNHSGECHCCNPFPYVTDRHPSFSFNTEKGLWTDHKNGINGDYVDFIGWLRATSFRDDGHAIYNRAEIERELMNQYGVLPDIDTGWYETCIRDFLLDEGVLSNLSRLKPWSDRVIRTLKLGFDARRNSIVIPIRDRDGAIVNFRIYSPGRQPKMSWYISGAAENLLFPHFGWSEDNLILVEGETDAISMREHGLPGVSGTLGSGDPVPTGDWYRDKGIWLCMDVDEAGRHAEFEAIQRLQYMAKWIKVIRLPVWPERPENADVSDWLMFLTRQGCDYQERCNRLRQLLRDAQAVKLPSAVYDAAPADVAYSSALSSVHLNSRIRFPAQVIARSDKRYVLSHHVNFVCPATGHVYCQNCPMRRVHNGNLEYVHELRSANSLAMLQTTDKEKFQLLRGLVGIPLQCPDVSCHTSKGVDVEQVMIQSPVDELQPDQRSVFEAMVLVDPERPVRQNHTYKFTGFVYALPKTQQTVFLINEYQPASQEHEDFKLTPELHERLVVFQAGLDDKPSVWDRLCDVADDLSNSVTRIRQRQDLHFMYRSVWYSALSFMLGGSVVARGWLDALVIGDTRCGKSETFDRLAEFWNMGTRVDCKNQSVAGVLGSVVTSPVSGDRFVVPGIFPQNHGRVVCFDEFGAAQFGQRSIIEHLSGPRSEGLTRITKAASAIFPSKVRSIWLANPGGGVLISELGGYGVECIPKLVRQPEDIARFDAAMCVAQSDVDARLLNNLSPATTPRYSQELQQFLLSWVYSLTAEQIFFTPAAEQLCLRYALDLVERYDATIPLVEPADQRNRIAKLAVSIAAQTYSTIDGTQLIVRHDHVEAAMRMLHLWYDKPAMGYHLYSIKQRQVRTIRDEGKVREIFTTILAMAGPILAEQLLTLDEFSERTFVTLCSMPYMSAKAILQQLYSNRCIKLVHRGRKDNYFCTPAFITWLKAYVERNHGQI